MRTGGHMRERELIVYRVFRDGGLLHDMARLMAFCGGETSRREKGVFSGEEGVYTTEAAGNPSVEEDMSELFYGCIHRLIELAGTYGFHGNLWHCYLTHLLVNHENSYSRGCEMRGEIEGTLNEAVLHDIRIFLEFFRYDFTPMCRRLHVAEFSLVENYISSRLESRVYNTRIRDRICELACRLGGSREPGEMKAALTEFYKEYGVGKFGLHKSFRIARDGDGEICGDVRIEPIPNIAHVKFSDLVGYEGAKKKLADNTDAFVEGRPANNCLLFGDAGTGKSSCIKALANEYYNRGLRVIEVYKHQFRDLSRVIGQIKDRNYKFIIFMDDLSFEDFETEYKYLKAVIEGGLEKKPDNVLIYATSNRRHLIRENYSDKEAVRQDMHTGDTVQEKLSLAYRFGVTIYFGAPDMKQFRAIVKALAERGGMAISEEELFARANQWELSHGGLSGRTARQFIDYLSGERGD